MKKNMTTLGKVLDRVDALSGNCRDSSIKVRALSFKSLGAVEIDGMSYPMRVLAQRSMAYRLGIPYQYLDKCPPEVQAYNMNYWLEKEKHEELFFRFDGDEVRAVFTPRLFPSTISRSWSDWMPSGTGPKPKCSATSMPSSWC